MAGCVAGAEVPGTEVLGTEVLGTDVLGTEVLGTVVLGTDVLGAEVPGTEVPGVEVPGAVLVVDCCVLPVAEPSPKYIFSSTAPISLSGGVVGVFTQAVESRTVSTKETSIKIVFFIVYFL